MEGMKAFNGDAERYAADRKIDSSKVPEIRRKYDEITKRKDENTKKVI